MAEEKRKEARFRPLVIGGTVLLPLVVALLYFGPKWKLEGVDTSILPAINACINGICTIILTLGWRAIIKRNISLHRKLMQSALICSLVFLLFYVLYHMTSESTPYGGEGALKYVYYFVLLTHILLAMAIVPLVLITYVRALAERFDRHRKIAKVTLPIWLYVSITGVVVYLMISPYYG